MMKKLFASLIIVTAYGTNYGQVTTPGTGVRWNMDSLAVHFPSAVVQSGNDFSVSEPVIFAENDTFFLNSAANVLFDSTATMEFEKSVILIQPEDGVTFSASDTAAGFERIRIDSVQTAVFTNFQLLHGSGISLIYSQASMLNCRLEQNKHKSNNPSGALSLLQSDIEIDSSAFIENARSAITIGATGNSGLRIFNSTVSYNGYENGNYPQINIGTANESGVIIKSCTLEGKYERAGAIGFLNATGTDYDISIESNTITNNRYGIAVIGRGVSGYILNNTLDNNNIEGDPMLGGSGINFQGDSSIHIIVSGNTITNNLWGVTVQPATSSAPQISLGRTSPEDPLDVGENIFRDNGNNDTLYAVYNNTPDTVWAQNNYWDFSTADSIETTIAHHPDDNTLGWVIFEPFRVDPPTTIDNIANKQVFAEIYPNPVSLNTPVLSIRSGERINNISLFDVQGREVYKGSGPISSSGLNLDISALHAGVYFVKIHSGEKIQHQKIVIQ